ncbi:hypothetical protein K525DRAFT_291507 [Schizophyllum commune Loenen D]|nr:hypothetical protein K525DRAFT_291507 [Schizophyllum commune Loenen D]
MPWGLDEDAENNVPERNNRIVQPTAAIAAAKAKTAAQSSESSDSSEDSSSSSESESDSDSSSAAEDAPAQAASGVPRPAASASRRSPSPPLPSTEIPSFLPDKSAPNAQEKEQELRDKFRKFWMSAVVDGFKDDLEEIRKEPNLNTPKLSLLIDSLASGADVFAMSGKRDVGEMAMVVD